MYFLDFCINIDVKGIQALSASCKSLVEVSLEGCVNVDDEAIRVLASVCTCVQDLNIAYCRRVTDTSMFHIAKDLWMESLDVSNCSKVTDEGLCAVIESSSGLLSLSVRWLRRFTDRSLEKLAEQCRLLRHLDVARCENISEDGLNTVANSNQTSHLSCTDLPKLDSMQLSSQLHCHE